MFCVYSLSSALSLLTAETQSSCEPGLNCCLFLWLVIILMEALTGAETLLLFI